MFILITNPLSYRTTNFCSQNLGLKDPNFVLRVVERHTETGLMDWRGKKENIFYVPYLIIHIARIFSFVVDSILYTNHLPSPVTTTRTNSRHQELISTYNLGGFIICYGIWVNGRIWST